MRNIDFFISTNLSINKFFKVHFKVIVDIIFQLPYIKSTSCTEVNIKLTVKAVYSIFPPSTINQSLLFYSQYILQKL